MKKIILYTIIFIFFALQGYSQTNLVPNYSFEDTLQCPIGNGISPITYSPPWFSPTDIIANYFNSCNNFSWGVPNNAGGSQYSHTGNAYAGIVTFNNGGNGRDYLEVELITPLIKDKKYCVEFFVSLSDFETVAANNMGVYFSDTAVHASTNLNLNLIPQINNEPISNPLTDKIEWIKISGVYISFGGEKYITIGNFLDDTNTDTTFFSNTMPGAEYYIDDVSVICCDCETVCGELFVPNVFSPNGDNQNDVLKVYGNCISDIDFIIFDRWGEKVFETVDQNIGWDGTYNGQQLDDAVLVYYLKATVNGKEVVKQGNVAIIK